MRIRRLATFLALSLVASAALVASPPTICPPLGAIEAAALHESDEATAAARGISLDDLRRVCTARGVTRAEVLVMTSARLKRAVERTAANAQPGYPDEYIDWLESFYRDEKGVVDPARMAAARAAARTLPLNPRILPVARKNAAGETEALVSPNDWIWKGPGNIGGRTRSLLIHPTQTNRMWLGSVGGGIWYTSDGGASWSPVNDFQANIAISTMIMHPTNPNLMWAGTGEGFFNSDGIRGAGVFKSIDGGVTWTQLANTATNNFLYVNRLAISSDGSTLLAATATGLFRSTDGGTNWASVQVTTDRMAQIAFDPNNSLKAIATGYSALAYYSLDGGLTWTAGTGLGAFSGTRAGRSEFSYAKSAPDTVYVGYWTGTAAALYKSVNGGQTYTQVTISGSPAWMSAQGWYDNAIWVDPTNANTLFVAGLDIYRSTNGGANLTKISSWQSAPQSAHADQHGIFPDPGYNGTTNKRVYFTNDGGIYKAEDALTVAGVSGWTQLNNNLGITQFYGAAGNPTTGTIVAGAQDNGTLRTTTVSGISGWTTMNGGDGGYCAADQTDPNYFYGEYVYATIARSSNGGASSSNIYSGITDANDSNGAEFIAPFILDPNNQSRMYVGGKSLWRSDNVKATTPAWGAIKPSEGTTRDANITAIAVAPGNPNVIWTGHRGGSVYVTLNGSSATPTWTKVDLNGIGLPKRRVGRIAVDPLNSSRAYVCFGGFGSATDPQNYGNTNLYRTEDNGTTWSNVTSNLPLLPIFGMVIRPDNSDVLYVATDAGVFGSEDRGATWSATNIGPSNVCTTEVFFIGSDLAVCSHGRGVFVAPNVLPPPPDTVAPVVSITPTGAVTNISPITFRFSFSENVTGFSATSVTVTGGTAGVLTGGPRYYDLPVTPTLPNNPVTVSIPAAAAQDASGNLSNAATASASWDPTSPFAYGTSFDGAAAPAGWSVTGAGWVWGVPTSGPGADHTGAGGKVYALNLAGNYADGLYSILASQPVKLPASASNPYKLRFWMWLSTEATYDGGNLELSVDGGPFAVVPSASLSVPYNSTSLPALFNKPGWHDIGPLSAWRRVQMDLTPYAGKTVQFRFVFGSDSSVTSTGWFIDDFSIEQDPLLTLAATTSVTAAGSAPGQFVISLQPSPSTSRTVNYSVSASSTATAGVDYSALPGSVTVSPFSTNATVSINALATGNTQSTTKTVALDLTGGIDYSLASPGSALVVIVGTGAFDAWRKANFSAPELLDNGTSGPNGNPSGDGISNLMKYALGLDPQASTAAQLPRTEILVSGGVSFQQLRVVTPSNLAVTYAGEVSSDLSAWSALPTDVEVIVQPDVPAVGQTTRVFRDTTPLGVNKRFIRLRATLP